MEKPSDAIQITGLLGSGSEAEVFEVTNQRDGLKYALRRLKVPSSERVPSLIRLIEHVRHPNILHAVGRRRRSTECIEEIIPLVRSEDAYKTLAVGGPPLALSLMVQAAAGLAALHHFGLVHRDIKPENIFVEQTGIAGKWRSHRLVLADLGLVSQTGQIEHREGLTGTLGYMAPEVALGAPHSCQSDQFSLGCWLYWAVTGRHLLIEGGAEATLRNTLEFSRVDTLSLARSSYSSEFWKVLFETLLHSEPGGRFTSTGELLLFLLEEAQRVSDESECPLELVFNPFALLPEEIESLRLRESVASVGTGIRTTLIRFSRSISSWEAVKILQCTEEAWSPETVVIGPMSDPLEVLQRIEMTTPRNLIVDDSTVRTGLSHEALHLVFQRFLRQESEPGRILILESGESGLSRIGPNIMPSASDPIEEIESEPPSGASLQTWTNSIFSCLPVDSSVLQELQSLGIAGPIQLQEVFSHLTTANALRVDRGRVTWRPESLPALRELARPGTVVAPPVRTSLASDLEDLFESLPDGIPLAILRTASEVIPGFSRALRDLQSVGAVILESKNQCVVSCSAPQAIVTRPASTGRGVRSLAETLLETAQEAGWEDSDGLICALKLRADRCDRRQVLKALLLVRSYLAMGRPRSGLRLLECMRRSRHAAGDPSIKVKSLSFRGRALAQLSEFDLTSQAWEQARIEYGKQGKPLQAAHAAFERESQQLALRPGFTAAAMRELEGCSDSRARRLRLFLQSEELSLVGYSGGFRAVAPEMLALSMAVDADEKVRAATAVGLARAAAEVNNIDSARSLGEEALSLARRSCDGALIGRALGFLAVLEQSRGRVLESEDLSVQREAYLGQARWTQRISSRSLRAGVAYERGKIRDVIEIELGNLAEAVIAGHIRLEASARRNLALAYLQENRLGRAISLVQDVDDLLAKYSELTTSAGRIGELESVRCGVFVELGRAAEALEKCRVRRRELAGSSGLSSAILLRWEGIALAHLGKVTEAQTTLNEALQEFKAAGAVDEQMETEIAAIQFQSPTTTTEPDIERLEVIETDARCRGLGRIRELARLTRVQVDTRLSAEARVELASTIRVDADAVGLERLALEALFVELRCWMEADNFTAASKAHRHLIDRLKVVSEGLRCFPAFRSSYFSDPKRQRVLEAGRRLGLMSR